MNKTGRITYKKAFLLIFLSGYFFLVSSSFAQTTYIPPSAKIFAHPGDTIAIFGNMILSGNFGTAPGSVVHFLGKRWRNTSTASLTGVDNNNASPGGDFYFEGNKIQHLAGGYNLNAKAGTSFPNLFIHNPSGLQLEDLNDLFIRGNLFLKKGYLLLHGQNALVDGKIYGYSDQAFVVTGNNIGGGSLYRKPLPAGKLVFPVGTDKNSYSPAALLLTQISNQKLGIRVFDHVFEKATSEKMMDSNYVKKTWVIRNIQGTPITIYLQHNDQDEGFRFPPFRDSSYVSLYHPESEYWDIDKTPSAITEGTLTTGKVRSYSYLNKRTFTDGVPVFTDDARTWFSVSTKDFSNKICPVVDFRLWAAQRYNGDWVQLFWRTNYELNVMAYKVQRKRDTATAYETIATIPAKVQNSNNLQYYYFADKHPYDGVTQYRLKIESSSGCVVYTGLQQVTRAIDVAVWPNPATGPVRIRVSGIEHDITMEIVNTWGQLLHNYTISNNRVLTVKNLPDATYFLVFRDPKQDYKLISSVKLVVQHYR